MSHRTMTPPRVYPPEFPFHIGTRLVSEVGPDGVRIDKEIPLTEEDFLHPQEEDRFLLTDAHSINVAYLRSAIQRTHRPNKSVRVFSDHRIDWQADNVKPMGPDVVVFDRFPSSWNPRIGTVKVRDVGATPLVAIEVTSPSTRHIDVGPKVFLYHRAGVPYYLIVDLIEGADNYIVPELVGYRTTPEGYVRIPEDDDGGLTIPSLNMRFQMEGDFVVAFDDRGERIPDILETAEIADAATAEVIRVKDRAEKAEVWAMAERAKADAERAKADAEKSRADALALELAELKAKITPP